MVSLALRSVSTSASSSAFSSVLKPKMNPKSITLSHPSNFGGLKLTFPSMRSFPCYSLPKIRQTICNSSTKPSLKTRLSRGEKLKGMFLFTASPTMAEIAALAGYDFIIVDLEHGPADFSAALGCIRAAETSGCTTVIRVPEISPTYAKKALDLGPEGIMFPKVETTKDAVQAVSYCHYPPYGVRGCAYSLVRDSDFGFDNTYLRNYREDRLVMCQVETAKGVRNIQDIMGVDGVDCITTGPRDLSASLGLLHDPGNPKVKEVMSRLETAVLESDPEEGGAFLAGLATPQDRAVDLKKRGYHMVISGSDIALFSKAAIQDIKTFDGFVMINAN
ncbi:unnamed protein product [Microthlaspi erraticum]|uniref:HpcH/HpaI aldolase/citrate lyase domain-containing protein n=1 Tax=Microthlaspi erraticum TaxID=1685480 RepID=A0A6D2JJE1_9BRAS|nr:unnamed protein product [Microthlaspi erraticum]